MITRALRWCYSGYDWPLYRDWLTYVVLVLVAVEAVFQVRSGGWWSLVGVPFAFAVGGYVAGMIRAFVRGYRETPKRRASH
jgi:hypothetical protein